MILLDKNDIKDSWQSFNDCGVYTNRWPKWILTAISKEIIFAKGVKTMLHTDEGIVEVADGAWLVLYNNDKIGLAPNGEKLPPVDWFKGLTYDL